jgi:septal ring factor EnvC (AmiA/AmiB activator)
MKRAYAPLLIVLLLGWQPVVLAQEKSHRIEPVEREAAPSGEVIITSKQAKSRELLKKSIQENNTELNEIRVQIEENRRRIKNLDQAETAVRRGHEEIQKEIELSRQFLSDMVQQELKLMERSELLKRELALRADVYGDRRENLARSLRSMYIRSQKSDLELILTSQSFSEALTSVKVSRTLTRLGANLLEEVRTEGEILRREQKSLNAALAEIWQTREEQNQENDRLEELLAEQMGALRDLETEKKDLKKQLVQMGINEQKLSYVLTDLEQLRTRKDAAGTTTPSENALAALAGELEWPVRGKLLRGFGRSVHPKFKTVTLNNGFNIAAPQGSPVAAVGDGTVEYSDHLPGFGQCVILDHGAGYYTLYAHLDGVFVGKGEEIARGQVIAEVGRPDTGDESQLYFEVRQGRTPLDPSDWLRSR